MRRPSIKESSGIAVIGMTVEGIITSWNPGAEATFGYRAEEVLGRSMDPLFPDRDQDEEKRILEEVRMGQQVGPHETDGLRKDGTRVPLSVSVSPIADANGQVIAASAVARDNAERKPNEDELRERIALRDQLTKVAASVPGVICAYRLRVDGSACMPYASPAIDDLFGVKPGDVAEDFSPIGAHIHPDDVGPFQEAITESARTMKPWRDTFRYLHRSKGEIWVEGYSMPSLEPDGSILWHGYVQDITHRKHADAELFATQQRLTAIMQALPVGVAFSRDTSCKEIEGNPALSALFGADPDDNLSASATDPNATGRRVLYFSGGRELSDAELPLQRSVIEQTPIPAQELAVLLPDERRWLAEVSGAPIRDQQGRVIGGVAVVTDITERKQAAQALLDADRRKNEFLAVLAHELRNPLAPIRNAVEVLCGEQALPGKAVWAAQLIDRQSRLLERLVNDLLDVARITHGRIQFHARPLPLQEVIEDSLQDVAPALKKHRHRLEIQVAEAPVIVLADPVRLAQVFTNLLSNAIKYTPDGGCISVSLTQDGRAAVVSVQDDGVGIPAEVLPELFDIFSRGGSKHPGRHDPDGLGVGLAIARQLAEQHGGMLRGYSDGPGRGSEFIVTLPIHAEAPLPAPRTEHEADPVAPHQPRRIMVVDDNPDVADSFKILLETRGHQVRALHSGSDALRALREFRPEVVFLDIAMPGMDGYQIATAIRAAGPDPQPLLVALTGYGQDSDRAATMEADFDRHLLKPPDLQQIEALLADLD